MAEINICSDFGAAKKRSDTVSTVSLSICHETMGPDAMIFVFCIETNENENMTTPNLWNSVKAVLRGRFIAIQAYLNKQGENQINNLTLIKQLEKEEMKNPKVSRRKEIIKIWAEIHEKETKETIANINKIKSG